MLNSTQPLVSIVIVNYNGLKFMEKCLASLRSQTYRPIEIILVDNGSTDGSIDYVRANFPEICILEMGENVGFAAGNNAGIELSKGELIATLNNDTEAEPGWIESLVGAMADESVGMCASKMLSLVEPGLIDSTGIVISRSGACWDRGMFELNAGEFDTPCDVLGPCAGAAMYRKKMLDQTGLFDPDFFAYAEDTDIAFRGQMAGWRCVYVPQAAVYHYRSGTAGFVSDFSVYYGNRNIIWNAFKNFPAGLLITSLPWIISRNTGVILYYTLRGYGFVALRSKLDALKGIPSIMGKRRRWSHSQRIYQFVKPWARLPRHK